MALQRRSSSIQSLIETTRGKTYTVLVITVLTIVLMVALAIAPAYLSITNQLKNNEAKKVYLDELQEKEDALITLANQELEYETQINLLNTFFPNKENDEFILANLDALASEYNVKLTAVNFDNANPSLPLSNLQYPGLVRVALNINLQGDLPNMQLFLSAIESFPATITVNSVRYGINEERLIGGETSDDLLPYQLSLEAEYYFWNIEQ